MSLLAAIKGRRGQSGFGHASTAEEVTEGLDLSGKVALVTGCNSGLGEETARVLAKRGAHILAVARSQEKAEKAAQALPNATPIACDLSEPSTILKAIEDIHSFDRKIDMLIANAGIMALPDLEKKHGLELQFLTNHIGHFVLVTGLVDKVAPEGRIVILSSSAHKMAIRGLELDNLDGDSFKYSGWRLYGRSKLANLMFARELSRRLETSGKSVNAVHPGVIRTNLGRHLNPVVNTLFAATDKLYAKSIPQGAATTCYVAAHPATGGVTGEYFADCNVSRASSASHNRDEAAELWDRSEEIAEAFS